MNAFNVITHTTDISNLAIGTGQTTEFPKILKQLRIIQIE